MSPQMAISYRPGQPQRFIATRTFDLGNTNQKAIEGQEVLFDGTLVTLPGHPPIPMPTLRGAIRVGWLVPEEDYDPLDQSAKVPRPAGVQMRPAEGGNPLNPQPRRTVDTTAVENEERQVMDVSAHAAQVRDRNTNRNYRMGRENRAVLPGESGYIIEEQDGRPVRGLQTQAKQTTNVLNAGAAIAQADSVRVQPGEAPRREDVMAAMTDDQRVSYLQELAARTAVHDPEGATRLMDQANRTVARTLAAQPAQQREGLSISTQVGGGTEIADMGGTGGATEDQVHVIEEGGMKFTTTNGPKKTVRMVDRPVAEGSSANDALCRQIAKSICADFPDNYVFTDSIRKKIARLQADFEDRPDIIKAVCAAETDMEVKLRLVQEFPEVFA